MPGWIRAGKHKERNEIVHDKSTRGQKLVRDRTRDDDLSQTPRAHWKQQNKGKHKRHKRHLGEDNDRALIVQVKF